MKRFKSILFCPLSVDVDAVVESVVDLVIANDATLTLFGVVPEAPRQHRFFGRGDTFDSVAAAIDEEQQRLTRVANRCDEIVVDTVVGSGNYAIGAVQQVLAAEHDLVVVTPDQGRDHAATINRLLRKCPCPVWVVRSPGSRVRRVLAAVNPVPQEAELNRLILEIASSSAVGSAGELHVVHAWDLFAEHLMRRYGGYSEAELEAERRYEREHRDRDLQSLLDACDDSADPKVHLEHGQPAQVIVDLVKKEKIDLLVIGTVARAGVSGLLMGNTAEHVLNEVRCSTIAVKPPGFISPLSLQPS